MLRLLFQILFGTDGPAGNFTLSSLLAYFTWLRWTLVLLLMLFYSFGVIFTQLVSDHCRRARLQPVHVGYCMVIC